MNEDLADTIVISVIWISAAAGSYFLASEIPFVLALIGTFGFVWLSRH
jgi:hypothetical protein